MVLVRHAAEKLLQWQFPALPNTSPELGECLVQQCKKLQMYKTPIIHGNNSTKYNVAMIYDKINSLLMTWLLKLSPLPEEHKMYWGYVSPKSKRLRNVFELDWPTIESRFNINKNKKFVNIYFDSFLADFGHPLTTVQKRTVNSKSLHVICIPINDPND